MNINLAPEKGIMYALYIDRMVFQEYTKDQLTKDACLMKTKSIVISSQD